MSANTLRLDLGERAYDIHIGPRLIEHPGLFRPYVDSRLAVVVTNETVAPIYAARLERTLAEAGARSLVVVLRDGEAFKNLETLEHLYGEMLRANVGRDAVLVALGGGVVGDIAGFAAATYQRGIDYVQVPTTLLAQVDSSVGGKTAVNHALGKNMIGAFHQPRVVVADTDSLSTLPQRELAAGLAEVAKHGAIRDREFLGWIEREAEKLVARDPAALAQAIRRSCEIKAAIVAEDEREAGVRALLNFGHTFGHAIESAMGYGVWLHGEAVAAGMVLAAKFSERQGRLAAGDPERLAAALARLGLPVSPPAIPPGRWLDFMARDKKNQAGRITLVLLEALGRATIVKGVPAAELEAFLAT